MNPHPIPKNLMEIEMKLFGSMTIKEFVTLAINWVIALGVYTLKLPEFIGWPIISFFIILGIAFAFVRLEGQSFPNFIANLIIALIMPQRRVWKKTPKIPDAFNIDLDVPKVKREEDSLEKIKEEVLNENFEESNEEINEFEQKVYSNMDRYFKHETMSDSFLNKSRQVITKGEVNSVVGNNIEVKKKETPSNLVTNNVISGIVLDKYGKGIQECSIVIIDKTNNPVRQTNTNIEGKFSLSTPLNNGEYKIITESKNKTLSFEQKELILDGNKPNQIIIHVI